MKVPWKWLCEYVDLPWSPEEAVERFTMTGLKVEGLSYEKLDLDGVVAGKVLSVSPLKDSDHLKVGQVDVGDSILTIVSGAPGFKAGKTVVVAKPNALLPGGASIGFRSFGGAVSGGMVLCANELLTGEGPREGEDIIILDDSIRPGTDVKEIFELDDYVLDLELTVNYSHCLSILGVAIEASAMSGQTLKLPPVLERFGFADPNGSTHPEALESVKEIRIELPDPDLCPKYVGKIVRRVKVGYSPVTVERRLYLAGMRPVNSVVDATNYVMLETGQPLHAFDLSTLRGGVIAARRARAGEKIVTLDGEERTIPEGSLVIADAEGPVAIAGVMGGQNTEVTLATRDILLESAWFSPLSVRLTSQKLALRTEAVMRFEKGVDPTAQFAAIERAAGLCRDYSLGEPDDGAIIADKLIRSPKVIMLPVSYVKRSLGVDLSVEDCRRQLSALRFGVDVEDEVLRVTVPPRRVDIQQEIDLVEEIARYHGYNNFEGKLLDKVVPGGPPGREYVLKEKIADFLASCGGYEGCSNSLVSMDDLKAMGWSEDDPRLNPVKLINPITSSESVLRTSILPGLLKGVGFNQRNKVDGGFIWEMGRVFFPVPGGLPREFTEIGLVEFGVTSGQSWVKAQEVADFFHIKGVVEALLGYLGISDVRFYPVSAMPFHPGKAAQVICNGSSVGEIGEIHPEVLNALDLAAPVVAAFLSADALISMARDAKYQQPGKFPPVERDLAVIVDDGVPAWDVVDLVQRTAQNLVSVSVFDVWKKPPVPEGKKSLALRLVYRASDHTLTEEELSKDRERILEVLSQAFGAKQRL